MTTAEQFARDFGKCQYERYLELPVVFVECAICGGKGIIRKPIRVYEHGCGFSHDDVDEIECDACNGAGGNLSEANGADKWP